MLNLDNKIDKEKIANETFVISRYLDDYFGLIVLSVSLLLIIVSYFFVCLPRYMQAREQIDQARNTINDEKNSLSKYKAQLTSYKGAYLSISDLDKQRINEIIGPLYKYNSIYRTDLMINYRDLLSDNGFELESIEVVENAKPKTTSKKNKQAGVVEEVLPPGVSMMNVALEVVNLNYGKFKNLLSILESELRIADIVDFSCTEGIEACSINLETYYFAAPEEEKK